MKLRVLAIAAAVCAASSVLAAFGLFQDAQGITYDPPPMSSPVDN